MKENNKWLLIGAVIGAVIGVLGTLAGAYITGVMNENSDVKIIQMQQKNELKTLAIEYLNDIKFVENSESNFENFVYSPTSSFNNPNSFYYHRAIWWQDPIYPTWGMYYSNREDLSKFNSTLSKELIQFYGEVLTAESERDLFNKYDKLFPRNSSDIELENNRLERLTNIWINMAYHINTSRSRISYLKQDLQAVADS